MPNSLRYVGAWTLLTLLQHLPGVASQNGGPPPQFSCYRFFGMAEGYVASAGITGSDLCATTGQLWSLISTGQACMQSVVTSVPVGGFDLLNTALSLCNGAVGDSVSKLCASIAAPNGACAIQSSYFGQPVKTSITPNTPAGSASATVASTATPAQTASPVTFATSTQSTSLSSQTVSSSVPSNTQTLRTDSTNDTAPGPVVNGTNANKSLTTSSTQISHIVDPSPSTNDTGSNIGMIIGVALGASFGVLFLIAAALILFWRRRNTQKHLVPIMFQRPQSRPPRPPRSPISSAFVPKIERQQDQRKSAGVMTVRHSPEGVPPYARAVGGLQELDSAGDQRVDSILDRYAGDHSRYWGMRTWYSSGTSVEGSIDRHSYM